MYTSSLSTDSVQYEVYNQLLSSREADEEFRIRELAAMFMQQETTFHHGSTCTWICTWMGTGSLFSQATPYNDINVRLHPMLRGTKEGQLIAEHIIRDAVQSARLEADCK